MSNDDVDTCIFRHLRVYYRGFMSNDNVDTCIVRHLRVYYWGFHE